MLPGWLKNVGLPQNSWVKIGWRVIHRCHGAFWKAWQGQKKQREEKSWPRRVGPGPGGRFPALIWLSLAGVLASRARLRFTRQQPL
jgi:hypothetical protein